MNSWGGIAAYAIVVAVALFLHEAFLARVLGAELSGLVLLAASVLAIAAINR